MKSAAYAAAVLAFGLIATASASASGPVISEVLFNPSGTDTGSERIKVYNLQNTPADLSGWQLYPDGIGYFSFPTGFSLAPHASVTIYLRATGTDTAADLFYANASGNMGNSAGSAALFSGEPRGKDTIRSFVQWGKAGETWESAASDAGLWEKGSFVDIGGAQEGDLIALKNTDAAATGSAAWGALHPSSAEPAPGAGDAASSTSGSAAELKRSVSPRPAPPVLAVSAGGDREAALGTEAEFSGAATGIAGQPITGARFWWNFGDGAVAEGRAVGHVYILPGTYRAALHVTSGEYAGSDYATVRVVPNQIAIKAVVAGEEGFVRLENGAALPVDMGSWYLEDQAGAKFYFPVRTSIASRADASFANRLTHLATGGRVLLRRQDGAVVSAWEGASGNAAPSPAPEHAAATSSAASLAPPKAAPARRDPPTPPDSGPRIPSRSLPAAAGLSPAGAGRSLLPAPFFSAALALSALAAVGFFLARRMIP